MCLASAEPGSGIHLTAEWEGALGAVGSEAGAPVARASESQIVEAGKQHKLGGGLGSRTD